LPHGFLYFLSLSLSPLLNSRVTGEREKERENDDGALKTMFTGEGGVARDFIGKIV
jgi:hypothetical protein